MQKSSKLENLMERLLGLLLPIIEKNIIGYYCTPWDFTLQRTLITGPLQAMKMENTAWQWHTDGVPKGSFKLLVYLSDVSHESAPFTHMVDPSGLPVFSTTQEWKYIPANDRNSKDINPLRSRHHDTRIPPEEIKKLLKNGYKPVEVCMPAGSFMVWNPNHLHKATAALSQPRDVVQFHLRPTLFKPSPSARWLGSTARSCEVSCKHDWWIADFHTSNVTNEESSRIEIGEMVPVNQDHHPRGLRTDCEPFNEW